MIRFLRNFRQEYIGMGSKNMTRYLFYAIGETLLIVFGILIALRITNWNQSRIETRLEQHFYIMMVADSDQSIEDLKHAIAAAQFRINNGNELLDLMSLYHGADVQIDSTRLNFLSALAEFSDNSTVRLIQGMRMVSVFDPRKAAFNEMMSSGNLSVIRDLEIRSRVNRFYEELEDWKESNLVFRNAQNQYIQALVDSGISLGKFLPEQELLHILKNSNPALAAIYNQMEFAKEQILVYTTMIEYIQEFRSTLNTHYQ